MHEYSIIQSLVEQTVKELEKQGVKKVALLRFRRGSAFSEEALHTAFTAAAAGTVLEGARLEIETVNLDYTCPCGHHQIVTSDDLHGHMFVCPKCGNVHEVEEAHDIELLEVIGE